MENESSVYTNGKTGARRTNFFRNYLIFSSKISELKSHSFLVSCLYVTLFYALWWVELFEYLLTNATIKYSISQFDDYALRICTEYFTLEGISHKLNYSTERTLLRDSVILIFICNFVYVVCFVYCWYSETENWTYRLKRPLKFVNFMHSCFFWALFLPFFTVNFRCLQYYIDDDILTHTSDGTTYAVLVFIILNIIISLFLLFNSAFFYNETKVDELDSLAGVYDDFKKFTGLLKLFTLIIRNFFRTHFLLVIIIETCNHILSCLILNLMRVVYNETINSMLILFSAMTLVLTFTSAVIALFHLKANYDPFILTFLVTPIAVKLLMVLRELRDKSAQKYFGYKVKTAYEAYSYISFLLHKVVHKKELDSKFQLILFSILVHHQANCVKGDCFCVSTLKIKTHRYDNPSTVTNYRDFTSFETKMILYIEHLYQKFLKKFPESPELNLSYSNFQIKYIGNIPKSIFYLSVAKTGATGLKPRYYVFKTMNEIGNYMNNFNNDKSDSTNNLELIKALEISQKYETFLDLFESSIKKNVEFFEFLCEDKANKAGILNKIMKSHNANAVLSRYFRNMYSPSSKHMGSLFIYGLFKLVILNKSKAYEYLKLAEKIKHDMLRFESSNKVFKKLEHILSSDSGLMTVNGERTRLGYVQYVNQSLLNILGYNKDQLINQKVDKVIPVSIAQHHDRYMRKFESHGSSYIFRSLRQMYAKHSLGHLVYIYLLVKPIFTLERGMQYLGFIKEIKDSSHYILTDQLGYIDSMTPELMEKLKIDSILLNSNSLKVDHFIKGIRQYYDKFNERVSELANGQLSKLDDALKLTFETHTVFDDRTIRKLIEKAKKATSNHLSALLPKKRHHNHLRNSNKHSSKGSDSSTLENIQSMFTVDKKSAKKTAPSITASISPGYNAFSSGLNQQASRNNAVSSNTLSVPTLSSKRRLTTMLHLDFKDMRSNYLTVPNLDYKEISCNCTIGKLTLLHNPEIFVVVELSNLYMGAFDNKNSPSASPNGKTPEASNLNSFRENTSGVPEADAGMSSSPRLIDYHNNNKESMFELPASKAASSSEAIVRHQNINSCLEQFKTTLFDNIGHYITAVLALAAVIMQVLLIISVYNFYEEVDEKSYYINLYFPSQTFPFEMAASAYILQYVGNGVSSSELASVNAFESEIYTEFFKNLSVFILDVVSELHTFIGNVMYHTDTYKSGSFVSSFRREVNITLHNTSVTMSLLNYFELVISDSISVANSDDSTQSSAIEDLISTTDNFVHSNSSLELIQESSSELKTVLEVASRAHLVYFIAAVVILSLFSLSVLLMIRRAVKLVNYTYNNLNWLKNSNRSLYESRRQLLQNFQVLKPEINQIHSNFESQILAPKERSDYSPTLHGSKQNKPHYSFRASSTPSGALFLRKEITEATIWILLFLAGNLASLIYLRWNISNLSNDLSALLNFQNDYSEERYYGSELLARQLYIIQQRQLHGNTWNDTNEVGMMELEFDRYLMKSVENDEVTVRILYGTKWYSEVYQENFCDLFFKDDDPINGFCNNVYEKVSDKGFPSFESKLRGSFITIESELEEEAFNYDNLQEKLAMINIFVGYLYINKRVGDFIIKELAVNIDGQKQTNLLIHLVLMLVMIFWTIVCWIAYYYKMKMILNKALQIKRSLRFFSDEALLSNKRVLVQICRTSSIQIRHILKEK